MSKVNLDEQLAKAEEQRKRAEERVKRLKERKQLRDAKKVIAENKSLKEQLEYRTSESLSNAQEVKELVTAIEQLFFDIRDKKLFSTDYTDNHGQTRVMVSRNDVLSRLQKIKDLQR